MYPSFINERTSLKLMNFLVCNHKPVTLVTFTTQLTLLWVRFKWQLKKRSGTSNENHKSIVSLFYLLPHFIFLILIVETRTVLCLMSTPHYSHYNGLGRIVYKQSTSMEGILSPKSGKNGIDLKFFHVNDSKFLLEFQILTRITTIHVVMVRS